MKMNTTEGNNTIAKFMRFNPKEFEKRAKNGLKYHSDWAWLMPVIEKIERTMADWDRPNYHNGYLDWMRQFKFDFLDMEKQYENVITFIEWYNKKYK